MSNDTRVLIAGIGNIFCGDDGFGVEVAKRLSAAKLPPWVRVADFGIRGIHLAFELLEREYDTTILIDAMPNGGEPGMIYLIEPDPPDRNSLGQVAADAHGMDPQAVLSLLESLGGTPGDVLIVACEPATTEEGIGLSEPVTQAVGEAVALVLDLLSEAPDGADARSNRGPVHVSGDSREDRRVL